ncbi:Flagellar biosynthesis protein FlhF [Planococcus massiliensis]|uniref:Flagellar biosynthesis protein FlhF n=1 Tax=Planococcus massiliensis TaxID=1499687 RepID=A0A098ESM0_9BACL|nr:flagellar biosynthesis protein FlhF [Planococcus massiliensis]CEG24321.1 Flagellar biosynthesis protein FlhF [Planococcus massiliensis]
MRLKTYIVNSVTEAIPMIKKDLGTDALILNTKKVKTGGFLGFFKTEKLEVIAAVETKAPEKTKAKVEAKPKQKQPATTAKSQQATVIPFQQREAVEKNDAMAEELMSEIKGIKQFMLQVMEEDRLPVALKGLNKQLMEQGISKEIQSELYAKLITELEQDPKMSEREIRSFARKEIIELIASHQPAPVDKNPEIICFIGPTGVGKTTTIAKIAADFMLREDKKVGLITSDTYRIAAVEQLKTYAGILNIPIEVVESASELTHAMEVLSDCDIVLMDTAGRNYQQKQYIEELEALLSDKNKVQINLVLSLTSKYEDMKKIVDNFQTIVMDELLLTKMDETSSSGAILNLIHHYSIPIRYIANGQSVPDDIFTVTPELIADFVLGEDEK